MSTEQVVNNFINCLENIDFVGAFGLLSESGKYVVIGTTPVSRTYHGRADVLENLVAALGTFIDPPRLKFDKPIIDGDRAVILASGEGVGPTGPYDQPYYAFVVRVAGEELVHVTEFMDTEMLNSAVFGKN